MANETITDDIVRDFFKTNKIYKDGKIIIEKQSTKNKKIDKLLANASKSGKGKGYPDFIIQYKENPDLLIVMESKAETRNHGKNQNEYSKYAIDGTLLYSAFLSKEYDVLSIAVSGETTEDLKVSHFLQLKNTIEAYPIFKDGALLDLEDYEKGFETDERKFNQDFQELLKYSKTLNDELHTLKVKESERSLLISGTLIALTDKAFCNSYKLKNPKSLANLLITTIEEKLNTVQGKSIIIDVISSYSFITTHTTLSKEENALKDVIDEIDKKINNFIQTYKYYDVLGQFYIEFLRYANNDKKLGIVLTPPHITELFVEISNINKDSVVLDTCTGTGGFLISAMRKMIKDAGGDTDKEYKIKDEQIIGVEMQHDIFALVCSNMYIHGDGRSNLIKGSCFNQDVKTKITQYSPNVGFLNPPYKTSVNDIEELEFVLNNLSLLEKGSYCVSIIPISCVISSQNKENPLKIDLLKDHTLEAVFSMPTELFHNSKVGVNTCVMICKAKESHPKNYKTYFGYWRDDGFSKRKNTGRGDYHNIWSKTKQKWIDNYRNKEEVVGHSVKKVIRANDEWCVEAYMQTNYDKLNEQSFKKTLKRFLTHKFSNNLIGNISEKTASDRRVQISIKEWRYFNLIDFFKMFAGKYYSKDSYDVGVISLISASDTDNGVMTWTNLKPSFSNNKITIGKIGATTYYQSTDFIASPDVTVLKPNFSMSKFVGLFLITVINLENVKWFYGRQIRLGDSQRLSIKLPTKNNQPDWQFMEDYIKSLPYSKSL